MRVDLAELDPLTEALVAAPGIRSATLDPAEVVTPGVLVEVTGIRPGLDAEAYTLDARLVLIVEATDPRRAMDALTGLLAAVTEVPEAAGLPITGPITPAARVLPGSTTPLPALAVPVQIDIAP